LKNMAEDYGNYTPVDFDEYVDDMIGDYSAELQKKTFTERGKTSYLDVIKYNADLVWYKYNIKQDQKDPTLALVNTDVLDVVLLSLHPKDQVKEKDISDASKLALAEMINFKDLILLEDYSKIWMFTIFVLWLWRRRSQVEWSWRLLTHRMGNPAMVLMMDNLAPNMAGDMPHFTSYSHFLQDLRIRFLSGDFDFLCAKIFFLIAVEMLAFTRIFSLLILNRNFILLLMMAFESKKFVFMLNLGLNEGSMMSSTIIMLLDMLYAAYIAYKPEMLLLDTVEAQIVFLVLFIAQLLLKTWAGETMT